MHSTFGHWLTRITAVVAALIAATAAYSWSLTARGYYVGADPVDLAELIVEKKLPPEECRKLRYLAVPWAMSPTQGEQRATCIYNVARLSRDPAPCELLLPGEYGLMCIGEVWGKLIDKSNCHWTEGSAVRCFVGPELRRVVMQCKEPLPEGPGREECAHRLASHSHDLEACGTIGHATLRTVCEIRIRAWLKYPALRTTQHFSLD